MVTGKVLSSIIIITIIINVVTAADDGPQEALEWKTDNSLEGQQVCEANAIENFVDLIRNLCRAQMGRGGERSQGGISSC